MRPTCRFLILLLAFFGSGFSAAEDANGLLRFAFTILPSLEKGDVQVVQNQDPTKARWKLASTRQQDEEKFYPGILVNGEGGVYSKAKDGIERALIMLEGGSKAGVVQFLDGKIVADFLRENSEHCTFLDSYRRALLARANPLSLSNYNPIFVRYFGEGWKTVENDAVLGGRTNIQITSIVIKANFSIAERILPKKVEVSELKNFIKNLGSRNVKYLILKATASWCSACQILEQSALAPFLKEMTSRTVVVELDVDSVDIKKLGTEAFGLADRNNLDGGLPAVVIFRREKNNEWSTCSEMSFNGGISLETFKSKLQEPCVMR